MIEYLLFALGIFLLLKGADFLIDGAGALARKLNVSSLLIGLTIVAFGTSLPELVVTILAALKGESDIIFGNIIGSNIANILLIMGVAATIHPVKVQHSTVWKEIPMSFLAAILLFALLNKSFVGLSAISTSMTSIYDGIILLLFFCIFIYYAFFVMKSKDALTEQNCPEEKLNTYSIIFFIITGLVGLYLGGKFTVSGAVFLAKHLGVSEFIISASVVAVGTSLPELFVGIKASLKKQPDLITGNIVGSNIFNILFVLAAAFIISPLIIPKVAFDMIFLIFVTFLLFLFMFIGKKHELDRWQGIVFLLLYAVYIFSLI
jgi:cation:H+ antiporter